MMLRLLLAATAGVILVNGYTQISPVNFGVVSMAEMETQPYKQEKGAEAIVLCDYGEAKLIYNNGFQIEYKFHYRLKVIKSAGYDYANIEIELEEGDRLSDLKACTHNLENNQIKTIPVDKKQFYKEKTTTYSSKVKFTFPQVRIGSIIEYSYTFTCPEIRELNTFTFQQEIPVRHAEFWAIFPEYFRYNVRLEGPELVKTHRSITRGYFNTTSTNFVTYRYLAENLPAALPEPYMPEGDDYFAGVTFTLTQVDIPGYVYRELSRNFPDMTAYILDHTDFGTRIGNTFVFPREVKQIIEGKVGVLDQMQAIYDHVVKHMAWNGQEAVRPNETLRKAYQLGSGSSAEINTILINMLNTAGIHADPVILATRDMGMVNSNVAIDRQFNYSLCLTEADGNIYLLDATDKFQPMCMIPFKCLNGKGWVLSKNRGRWIDLNENARKSVQITYNLMELTSGKLGGLVRVVYDGYPATEIRHLIHNAGLEAYEEDEINRSEFIKLSDFQIENLYELSQPLRIQFRADYEQLILKAGAFQYMNPFFELITLLDNSWVKEERAYPVDLGCPSSASFLISMQLSDKLAFKEIPKPMIVSLPNEDATFSYQPALNNGSLIIQGELKLNRTFYTPQQYIALREFFSQIIRKKDEMVLLQTK